MNANFDYVYYAEDWEYTFSADSFGEFNDYYVDGSDPGSIIEVSTLIDGPKKFAARVPVSFDEDGSWDEEEIKWFDTREEAQKAIDATPTQ